MKQKKEQEALIELKAKEMAESMKGVDALFVSKSGDITATNGFPLI